MKKLTAFIIVLSVLSLLMTACGKSSEERNDTTSETTASQNYETIVSEITFPEAELITFSDSAGSHPAAINSITVLDSTGGTSESMTGDAASNLTFSADVKAPFGVGIGDSLSDIVNNYNIKSGNMAIGQSEYTSLDEVDVGSGTAACFGFGKDANGDWAFMDYQMVTSIISGNAQFINDPDILLFSFVLDTDQKITTVVQIYAQFSYAVAALSE